MGEIGSERLSPLDVAYFFLTTTHCLFVSIISVSNQELADADGQMPPYNFAGGVYDRGGANRAVFLSV